jgi:mRNA interferase RelE/StbE
MAWTIEFSTQAEKALDKLHREHAERILRFLFDRVQLLDDPRSIGEALRGPRLGLSGNIVSATTGSSRRYTTRS